MVLSLLREFLKMLCCMHIHLKSAGMIIVCIGQVAILFMISAVQWLFYTVLNLLFHWFPLICSSIVFRDRSIVM